MSIGIGPVQDFIASARRSRDLWFGSWLLSELSKTTAKTIVEKHGDDLSKLIFPAIEEAEYLEENGDDFSVVNKIVAVVENPAELGRQIRDAMQNRLERIRKTAYGRLDKSYLNVDLAEKQVTDLVEFFWTAVKFDDENDYKNAREKVEYLFAARKATRNFNPVNNARNFDAVNAWGANVPKSSLDGQRESVVDEKVYDDLPKDELFKKLGLRAGERLCGVGLLKRHGNRAGKDSFFSTSHVASLPLLEYLKKDAAENLIAVNNYARELSRLLNGKVEEGELYKILGKTTTTHAVFQNYDGHILFEERLGEFFTDARKLKEAKAALAQFFKAVEIKQTALSPYYALLLADGDAMGKAIDAQKTKEDHRELSKQLSAFAKVVKKIVENRYKGSLVYAGGDDVLAFVPLHTVLKCAKLLAYIFERKLRPFKITENDKTFSPTLSAGIAVAHHLEPLSDALDLARRAEKAAKAIVGKNALAVVVDKRSGASRVIAGRRGKISARLRDFIRLHRADEIPDGAAYQLRDLSLSLEAADISDETVRNILEAAKEAEAKRILKRKKSDSGTKDLDVATIQILETALGESSVEQLADELIIARIFADAENLAFGKPEKTPEQIDDK